jgi:hypothetical protein
MCDYMNLIQTFAPLTAVGGLGWAIISYRLNHRRTLALERTKFIFEQSKFFDTDPSIQTANKILYGFSPDFTVDVFLRVIEARKGNPEEIAMSLALENYLNFLWRVAYTHFVLKTITLEDLDAFGYYFYKIQEHKGLYEYCMKDGFEEIIMAAKKLQSIWDKADAQKHAPPPSSVAGAT